MLRWKQDAAQKQTDYTYDYDTFGTEGIGELLEIAYPAVELPDEGGSHRPKTIFEYNTYGQVETETKAITDSESTTTRYFYYLPNDSQRGALEKTIVDFGGLNIQTSYDYDSVGNIASMTEPKGNETTYVYSPSRRLEKETAPAPFGYETYYEYFFQRFVFYRSELFSINKSC